MPRIRKYQRPRALSSIACLMVLADEALSPNSSRRRLEPFRVLELPEARDRGDDEAERKKPEEQAIGETAGDQRATGGRLSLERHEPDSAAGHAVPKPMNRPLDPRVERDRLGITFRAHHVPAMAPGIRLARCRLALDRLVLLLVDGAAVE